jgi:hypothetical protein
MTEGAIKNGESRETGNIGHTRHKVKTLYLYTFSLYEKASLIIFSAETEYISTRS